MKRNSTNKLEALVKFPNNGLDMAKYIHLYDDVGKGAIYSLDNGEYTPYAKNSDN